ncbi:MAG: molybdopterin cofactor-binding domain-containing protein, partial [Rhizobacter sp.]
DVAIHAYSARTNLQSNTAFRGFGGPQGAIAIEYALDEIARHLGKDSLAVRRANYLGRDTNNVAPYGQVVTDNIIHELTDQLAATSDYAGRRAAIEAFNATSPVLKKGLALTPLKFGISFNVVLFNQAGAQVHVYTDGSVLVNHGGTEMGQGLNTKCQMIVAHELGVSAERVRCTPTDTEKVPNTSPTAASTGADLNGKAAQDAARRIRERLAAFAAKTHGGAAADVEFAEDEVIVDTLTGEWRLTRSDLLHDAGRSLNPAIDIGQVEGAFIQGMGWMTMEELVWHPTTGFLMTHAPSTYKIPTANDAPAIFNTALF